MAVDSKHGETTNGANGAASEAAAALARRRKSSSLMQAASSLPTVEHSLEEFIAKANQTLVDVNTWTQAETQAREEDERRKEQDAQRWKQAEAQMRDSDAREQALRKQLDGLQGKLAEAEARAAVALSASSSSGSIRTSDATIAELKEQIGAITGRMQSAEEQSQRLSMDLSAAQNELRMSRAMPAVVVTTDDEDAGERVRLAEAKAAKALAAARAAAAGLTVSSADLAAIESGLVVAQPARRRSPVVPVVFAFVGGVAIMFAVWKFALAGKGEQAAPPAPAPVVQVQTQPVAAPVPAPAPPPPAPAPAPVHPTVTPIDEHAAAQPAPAKPGPTVTPIEEASATPAAEPAGKPAQRPTSRPPAKKVRPGITDPFETKKPDKKAAKPPGGIVDPF